jgi:multidrug transporter EmrE-like cation transporter
MNATSFILVLCGVLLNAAAQLLLKAGTNSVGVFAFSADNLVPIGLRLVTEPAILCGLGLYVLSVVIWIMALSRLDVSLAYPMLSIGYVVNAVAAWQLFGETLTSQRLIGIGTIIIGVFLVARS